MASPFDRLTRRIPAIGVAAVVGGDANITGFGSVSKVSTVADLSWEIGSITKVFTGILLAEASNRGEVAMDDPIGRHAPDEVAARLPNDQPTLRHLATHTAGLPRLPRSWLRRIKGADPYSQLTPDDVWEALGPHTSLAAAPRFRYSNLGMGLLGHLLERAAGKPYGELITERITRPLEMRDTGVGVGTPVQGFRRRRPTPPWTFGALEGAGAIRSTLADMATFAQAVLDPPPGPLGTAITASREVVFKGRVQSCGLGWLHRLGRAGTTWHNGGTYGGSAFLAVNTADGTAVVAFGNRGPRLISPLDGASWEVLDGLQG